MVVLMDSDQPLAGLSTTQRPVSDSEDQILRDDDDSNEEAEDEGLDWTMVLNGYDLFFPLV